MKSTYRTTGFLYIAIIVLGLFSEVVVRGSVTGDPLRVGQLISENSALFRIGIASDMVVFLADVAVAALLYLILAPFGKPAALVAAAFRLTGSAVYAANLLNQAAALLVLDHVPAADASSLAAFYLSLQSLGYDLGLLFFGVHCIILGFIFRRAGSLPGWLGGLLLAAGAVYLVGSSIALLAPTLTSTFAPVYAVALLGELALAVWLIRAQVDPDQLVPG